VLNLLTLLVDKSLVLVEQYAGTPRYRLLEPIRSYALDKLADAGEAAAQRTRHAAWYLSVAESAAPRLAGPEEVGLLDRLETEHDSLRAALDWFLQQHHGEAALRLAVAMWRFWHRRSHFLEGCHWLELALATRADTSADLHGTALNALSQLLFSRDDFAEAVRRAPAARRVCEQASDTSGVTWALINEGLATYLLAESSRAAALLEESLRIARHANDRSLLSMALRSLGRALLWVRGPEDHRVPALLRESLALAREDGSRHAAGMVLTTMGDLAWRKGQARRANALWGEAFEVRRELADRWAIVTSLGRIALGSTAERPPWRAARLLAAAHAQRELAGVTLRHDERPDIELAVAANRATLGKTAFAAAWAEGQAMSFEEVLTEAALSYGSPHTVPATVLQ